MTSLRQISFNGGVRYSFEYTDIADADAWYDKQVSKGFLPAHTVADVVNPDYVSPDDEQEIDRLDKADVKFKKLTISALKDINQAQPNLFSQETKDLFIELKALLR